MCPPNPTQTIRGVQHQPLPSVKVWEGFYFTDIIPIVRLPRLIRAPFFFLFGALHQFFFDGNKRTSRFMMNGVLMSYGIDAISGPAAKIHEFNEKMVEFYLSKDATKMMTFLAGCHPDA